MEGGVSSAKSILEKPLKLLTEDDILQLTREDCRRFLKEKGMRRPSWNKSQAIQQVLSLKALFEPGDLRKILVSHPLNPSNELGACGGGKEDDGIDSPRSAEFSGGSGRNSPRSTTETSAMVGQMAIFYSGKVNVYDGVPPEKALSIMQLAANPIDLPESTNFASDSMVSSPMGKEKMVEHPQYGLKKGKTSRDSDVESQGNRKVSLQRYREKRKDRFSKAKKTPKVASSGLEMFLNCQPQMKAAPHSQNLACTGSQMRRESPENETKSSNLSAKDI